MIVPAKVALYLEYVRGRSLTRDAAILLQTLAAVARRATRR